MPAAQVIVLERVDGPFGASADALVGRFLQQLPVGRRRRRRGICFDGRIASCLEKDSKYGDHEQGQYRYAPAWPTPRGASLLCLSQVHRRSLTPQPIEYSAKGGVAQQWRGSRIEGAVIATRAPQGCAKVFGLASSQARWSTGPALFSRSCPGSKNS